jgi:type I restriction enzyme R subunit
MPANLHREINFEVEICQHLGGHGWLYAEGDAAHYDRARAIFPSDVLAWVQAAQPDAWQTLEKNHGAQAAETLLARLRDQLDQRGTLDVLRKGIELLGLRQPLQAGGIQTRAGHQRRDSGPLRRQPAARGPAGEVFAAQRELHRPGAVPQRHSGRHVELKTDFTQSVNDAIDQYRFDRLPRPRAGPPSRCSPFPAARWCISRSATAKRPW